MTLDSFRVRDPGRFAIETAIRYADLDPNDHVNHARYLGYLEEARLAFRRHLAPPNEVSWPIAELSIRYVRSAMYPGILTVELAPIHVGRTAFTLGYGIFDAESCVAVAMTRSVCVDRATGQKVALDPEIVARLRETAGSPEQIASGAPHKP